MRILPALLLIAVPLFGLAGCGSKGAVSLTVRTSSESLTVQESPFGGAALSGGFELELVVGPEASGGSDVTLGNFTLQNATGDSLVDVLRLSSATVFPLRVDKGATQRATFTFDEAVDDASAVCAGTVVLIGTIQDSLSGGTQSVRSAPITPACPPRQ